MALFRRLAAGLVLLAGCSSHATTTSQPDAAAAEVSTDAAMDAGPLAFPELDPTRCVADGAYDALGYDPKTPRWTSGDALQDRLWYLLTVLQQDPAAHSAVAGNAQLVASANERASALATVVADCKGDVACIGAKVRWSEADIAAFAAQLSQALPADVVVKSLRGSGAFALHAQLSDAELVSAAATDALTTLRTVFDGWAAAHVDLPDLVTAEAAAHPAPKLAFEPMLHLALAGLRRDGRDQAARYEPLDAGQNAAAVARMKTIDWKQWRFPLILVPGEGPVDTVTVLDSTGQDRCDFAFERWKAGLAPFLLLSGGHVHPDGTPYSEAIEMKNYLMSKKGMPENAILVDPYARHTTTNVRNAAREALRYGVPPDRPLLVTSDVFQTVYIDYIGPRCEKELGYKPFRVMVQLGDNDSCWLPDARSLFDDARDERDP